MPSSFRARISSFRAKIYRIVMFCDIIQQVVSKTQLGYQSVLLRADDEGKSGIEVILYNNVIYLKQNGELLKETDLYEFDEIPKISIEEDKRNSCRRICRSCQECSNREAID